LVFVLSVAMVVAVVVTVVVAVVAVVVVVAVLASLARHEHVHAIVGPGVGFLAQWCECEFVSSWRQLAAVRVATGVGGGPEPTTDP
jgi:hypothetical protein